VGQIENTFDKSDSLGVTCLEKNNNSVLGPVKNITFSVLAAITAILVTLVIIHNFDRNRSIDDKIIINVLGKQRMYTQLISKDVSELHTLILENEGGISNLSQEEIDEQMSGLRNSMDVAREEFSTTLTAIHNERIHYDTYSVKINFSMINDSGDLKEIDALWADFNEAVQIVVHSNKTTPELLQAFNYIDDNNIKLLTLWDRLLDRFLKESLHSDQSSKHIEYGLMIAIFVLLAFYLYNLLRFIILPYNQLYKGISEIGLSTYQLRPQFPTRTRVTPMVAEINDMFLKIDNLITLVENISNNKSFMETLTFISKTFSVFIPYNYIGIALISEDKKYLRASYGVSDGSISGLTEKVIGINWPVSDTSLGPYLESGEARIINDLEAYCTGKPLQPYNKIIMEAGVRASIALPLKVSGEPVGMIFFSSKNKNVYNKQHLNILSTLANSIAISMNQNIFAREMQYSSILALAKLSEARDEDTGEHIERMSKYSKTITVLLHENNIYSDEITVEYIDQIERFSSLHDIGKVGITDNILLKPGKLTSEEFDEMKKHTIFGTQVLKAADKNMKNKGLSMYGMGAEIAEGHHEKWDGSGYPYGRKGTEIPLSARITAVADVFDALTSKRPYKEAFSLDKSFAIIEEGKGTHFDPVIVDVFLKNRSRMEEIYYKVEAR
jgi:response regulator RpfG family c-di-GMP phosphodiesterase